MGEQIMKKLKICTLVGIVMIMSASIFTGCTTDEATLVNAFEKAQTITSEKTYTNMSVKVSATNMSDQEKESLNEALPLINSSKIYVASEINESKDKTANQVEEDMDMQLGGMPLNMKVWANEDLTGTTPSINEIVKMPQTVTDNLPTQFKGKDYMVLNSSDMTSASGAPQIDYSKLMIFSQQFQTELTAFMSKYVAQFNPSGIYITKVGSSNYVQDNKTQNEDIYELNLTDSSLKDLMHYTLNNLASNTDAVKIVKDYVSGMASIYGIKDTTELDTITNNLPQEILDLNTKLSAIDNLKILGDDGIKIRYIVNADGYIVNENGTAQFIVNLPSIIKLMGQTSSASDPTGIYTINLYFDTAITNINGTVLISLPQVDSTNSFNYTDLIKASAEQATVNNVSPQLMIKGALKK
jgi:hypothetical protein